MARNILSTSLLCKIFTTFLDSFICSLSLIRPTIHDCVYLSMHPDTVQDHVSIRCLCLRLQSRLYDVRGHVVEAGRAAVVHLGLALAGPRLRGPPRSPPQADGVRHAGGCREPVTTSSFISLLRMAYFHEAVLNLLWFVGRCKASKRGSSDAVRAPTTSCRRRRSS